MKWKDPVVAKELIKRIKSIEKRIENYAIKIEELKLSSESINELLQKELIIDFGATYILDTLICDNYNNITKYAYEYGYRNWNGNKLIQYSYDSTIHPSNMSKNHLNLLKKVFE